MDQDTSVHDSSGNVFVDMGMSDAEERLAKAELARVIRTTIEVLGLTAEQAAAHLGLEKHDVVDMLRGRLARFARPSLQRVVDVLGRVERDGGGVAFG